MRVFAHKQWPWNRRRDGICGPQLRLLHGLAPIPGRDSDWHAKCWFHGVQGLGFHGGEIGVKRMLKERVLSAALMTLVVRTRPFLYAGIAGWEDESFFRTAAVYWIHELERPRGRLVR